MNNQLSPNNHSFFEVKESRQKFLILGCGALAVALFLLIFTPRFCSIVTLIGALLAFVGLVMIYKAFYIKTLLRIDNTGAWTRKYGLIPWSNINDFSFDTISKSAVLTLHCHSPYNDILIDLSMSTLSNIQQVKNAMTDFSGKFSLSNENHEQ